MKKSLFFLLCCLLLTGSSALAQSALCITNTSDCVINVAMFAEDPTAPLSPPAVGCYALRIDIEVNPGSTVCYADYSAAAAASVTGLWNGSISLPPAPGPGGFRWNLAQIQKITTERIRCTEAGCGVQITAPGSGCLASPCSTVCTGVCGSWTPGAIPGDVTIVY